MKKTLLLIVISLIVNQLAAAQSVTIDPKNTGNTPNIIDLKSDKAGIVVPRMTTALKNAITNKVDGMMVYDTDIKQFSYWVGGTAAGGTVTLIGYWQNFGAPTPLSASLWNANGNDINNSNSGNVVINNIGFPSSAKLDVQSNTANAIKVTQVGDYEGVRITSATTNNVHPVFIVDNYTSAHSGLFWANGTSSKGLQSQISDANNANDAIEGITSGSGNGGFFNSVSGIAGYFTSASGKALVTGSGNVGIGTNTPQAKLDIAGNLKIADGTQGAGKVLTSDANGISTWQAASNWNLIGNAGTTLSSFIGTTDNKPFIIKTNDAEALRIDAAGSVGIGLSDNGPKVTKLYVNGNAGIGGSALTDISSDGVLTISNDYQFGKEALSIDGTSIQGRDINQGGSDPYIIKLNPFGGNVGIGTGNPNNKLQIGSSPAFSGNDMAIGNGFQSMAFLQNNTASIWYTSNKFSLLKADGSTANVGIGTTTPTNKLQIGNTPGFIANDIAIGNGTQAMSFFQSSTASIWYTNTNFALMPASGTGNVGIGVSNPQNKLEVNGITRSKEVIVETGWADYVFDEDYQLPKLTEVENFIKENKHLPEFPSAAEIQKNGAKLAELTTKMMQKIEELTLYSIEQNKKIEQLQNDLAELKKLK